MKPNIHAELPARGNDGKAHTRINSIDALRAFAMVGVIMQHCGLLPFGWIGVWLFFVISGFVVTTSLLERPLPTSHMRGLVEFYSRRAARILPIYWGFSLAGLIASVFYTGSPQWRPFFSLILFYFNFEEGFGHGGYEAGPFSAAHLWTISVEMQFYLVFGVAFAWLSRRMLIGLLLSFLALAPLGRFLMSIALARHRVPPLDAALAIYVFSFLHFDSFGVGALAALLRRHVVTAGWSRRIVVFGTGALTIYCAAYVAINYFVRGDRGVALFTNVISGILYGQYREVFLYSALAFFCVGIVVSTVAGRMTDQALLGNKALQLIGKISYGGYVYHPLFIAVATLAVGALPAALQSGHGHAFRDIATFAIALPLTIGTAYLSYRYVERPIMAAVGRRLANSRPSR